MRTILVALLAIAMAPSLAEARPAKGSSFIRVTNDGDDILAVIVDDNGTLDTTNLDASRFFRNGGRLIGPGGTTTFAVRAGSHTVTGAYVNTGSGGFDVSSSDS